MSLDEEGERERWSRSRNEGDAGVAGRSWCSSSERMGRERGATADKERGEEENEFF